MALLCLFSLPYLGSSSDSLSQAGEDIIPGQDAKEKQMPTPKEFVGNERMDGNAVCCKLYAIAFCVFE